jgi:hypothetical protein
MWRYVNMAEGKTRHMFAGGNTAEGFFSYYDHILPQDKAERIIILKGGPGVGKSTFMKKIASQMLKEGFDVEYMHCSSDPDSLDGVLFPRKNTALVDGTAPHIVDPKNPGAVDEIINLGEFWDNDGFDRNRDNILNINRKIGITFQRAYRYISAVYAIYKDNEALYGMAVRSGKANVVISQVISDIFEGIDVSEVIGRQRRLFASAITPKGFVSHLSSLITTGRIIKLKGEPGTRTERLLERVIAAASERGIDTETYYCALNPHKVEHVVIPELDISITTVNPSHIDEDIKGDEINFNDFVDESVLEPYRDDIEFNREEYGRLLEKAVQVLKQAKKYHDDLENYYIPNMNFDSVQKCQEAVLDSLLRS